MVIAVAKQPMSGLIYIAHEEGFFKAEGLEVTLSPHVHGKRALQDLIEGTVDLATAAELPFISALASGRRLTTIGTIGSSDKLNLIVARKDRGIERPRDLMRKRIGVIQGTSSEIFLDAFLVTHLISNNSVVRVPIKPEDVEQHLMAGTVDAVSTWALPGQSLAAKLNSTIFAEVGLYIPNWFLLIPDSARTKNHHAYVKLLRALLRAEEFEAEQPDRARRHVARHLEIEPKILAQAWDSYYFNVGLHQYVVTNLETHARLLHHGDSVQQMDFLAAMAFGALAEIDPDRVTVIH